LLHLILLTDLVQVLRTHARTHTHTNAEVLITNHHCRTSSGETVRAVPHLSADKPCVFFYYQEKTRDVITNILLIICCCWPRLSVDPSCRQV